MSFRNSIEGKSLLLEMYRIIIVIGGKGYI